MSAFSDLLAFVKLYDNTLPDNHVDNYYMEREWRILNNLKFELNDIKSVYLPDSKFISSFKNKFPNYKGEFIILDE